MPEHDCMYTVYGDCQEEWHSDFLNPKGKLVRTTSFRDANLYHCKVTGKAATGILHLVNQTPIDWYSRKQPTVETATYRSKFVVARICNDQIIDLRFTLHAWVYRWKRQLGCWVTIVLLSLHLPSHTQSWENAIMHFHTTMCVHPLLADISNSVTLMANKTLPTF